MKEKGGQTLFLDFYGKINGMEHIDITMIINSIQFELDTNPDLKLKYRSMLFKLMRKLERLESSF